METTISSSGPAAGRQPPELFRLLQKTSRTFALSIPLLPEPVQTEVAVAYLLFRIIDTFEDAARWSADRRKAALAEFARLLENQDEGGAQAAAQAAISGWLRDPPIDHAGYLELLEATPRVLGWFRALRPAAAAELRRHVARSARGMSDVVDRTDEKGVLRLETLQDLRDYCYIVAGIVGEMLTELFILQSGTLAAVAPQLRERARSFGEALQLVNILKDASADQAEGRVYLPRRATLAEVFVLAREDLAAATAYIEFLRRGGADRGLVAFNALNARLAIATLHLLRERGAGAKLPRTEVLGIAAEVMRAVETGGTLFPERI
jgi:farnesyl-diphosphate farnesyltransferase